ncbi:MAG: heme-binding protein [Pseudomonadota bacterium]
MKAIIAAAAAVAAPLAASALEEPAHQVVVEDGPFQVRAYDPMILASVQVEGSQRDAPNQGFQPLADYIFGANLGAEKIEMTAPVTQTRAVEIDMTAPVTQTGSEEDGWTIAFVMPAEWTMETLPKPLDPAVTLSETPARTVATIRFAGGRNAKRQARKQTELEDWIEARGLSIAGAPEIAFYDPPWVPGPFRRNEILIPVTLEQ